VYNQWRATLNFAMDNRPTPPVGTPSAPQYLFTIFIPSHNRAHLLPIALESVERLKFRDFEVVIVDDGSTDNTRELVQQWIAKAAFPIQYIWQENQGMHASHNTAIAHARGKFLMRLDSDDSILPEALDHIKTHWEAIPDDQKPRFAGVAGLCLNEDGTISGDRYPQDVIDSDYLEIFTRCRMNGERRECLRTDVLREYPFPRLDGERRLRSTLILRRMAHRYKIRFTNEVLQVNRHAVGGITANRFKYRMLYPQGQRLYYLEGITLNDRYAPRDKLRRHHIQYVRYSLHSGIGLRRQSAEIKHRLLWLIAVPVGVKRWLYDRLRMRWLGIDRPN
jgi:glycosyltransferase involved in cell wall biosynthesis